jgi:hypothetical protein
MTPTAPSYDIALWVAERAVDEGDPHDLAKTAMLCPLSWVLWHESTPVAMLGASDQGLGVWRVYCFHTEDFGKIVLSTTRFAKKVLLPLLFDKLGAVRVEGASKSAAIQRLMQMAGGAPVGTEDGAVVFAIDAQRAQV